MSTRVSIILPVYNGARSVGAAIQSVQAQTYTNWELLVVDDGSTDNIKNVVTPYLADTRIVFIQNEHNLGLQKTLNVALARASGVYTARIDADDIWCDPKKLESQIEYFVSHPECVLVGTDTIVVDTKAKELYRYSVPHTDTQIRRAILFKNCFVHSSVVFKTDVARELGGYSEEKKTLHVEDYDLWLKLGQKGNLANLAMYGVQFQSHDQSISAQNKVTQFKRLAALALQYRHSYPRWMLAVCFAYFRLVSYTLFIHLVPKAFVRWFITLYKR